MPYTQKQKDALLKAFGRHVEALIYKKFKDKEEFLRKTGIYRKSLHDVLTGVKDARITTIYRIAEELGVTIREMFPEK